MTDTRPASVQPCLRICLPPGYCNPGTRQSLDFIAAEIARFLDIRQVRHIDHPDPLPTPGSYALPAETLTTDQAQALGIRQAKDLYGGVVPHAFLIFKTAAHSLPEPGMTQPPGWRQSLGLSLRGVVLSGFSVFSCEDAIQALDRLRQTGHASVRVKLASANAGRGQSVVHNRDELENLLDRMGWQDQFQGGLVLEENLFRHHTFSVGQAEIGNALLSYIGRQHTTLNLAGEHVYGGSTLLVARGGYEQLMKINVVRKAHALIDAAIRYEQAFFSAFPTLYASRRNYDVILGINANGARRLGVLEHAWRCGGASAAEMLALHALQRNPQLGHVHAWTRERYVDRPDRIRYSPYLYSLAPEEQGYLAKFGGPR